MATRVASDHLSREIQGLPKSEILILDEVDRMLDIFIEDVTKIIQKTPRSRQTLLFRPQFQTR